MTPARICIVIPAFNAEQCIGRAIASLQAQTMPDWEAVVVDDASTDQTRDVVARMAAADARIRLIALSENGGAGVARNAGLAAATAEWIGILDADDAYTPARLEHLLACATTHNLDMLADNQLFYDRFAAKVSRPGFKPGTRLVDWTLLSYLHNDRHGALFTWALLKPIFRRAFLDRCGLVYREQFRYAQDSLFYMEALALGAHAMVTAVPGYIYTTRVGEITRKTSGLSRTPVKLATHMATYDWFEAHHTSQLTPAVRRGIAACRRAAAVTWQANQFKDNIHGRNLGEALRVLARKPAAFPLIGKMTCRALQRRGQRLLAPALFSAGKWREVLDGPVTSSL